MRPLHLKTGMRPKLTHLAVPVGLILLSCEPPAPMGLGEPETLGLVEGVVRAEGAAVVGVAVALSGSVARSTVTDGVGAYGFDGLPAGAYLVELGDVPAELRFDVRTATATLGSGSWQASADFDGVRRREAGVEVEVRILGEGLADILVSLTGAEARTSTTDSSGAASFEALLPGPYAVAISGWDPLLIAFPAGESQVEAANGAVASAVFEGVYVLPVAPTDPSANAMGPSSIRFTWADASDNEDGFEVERRLTPDGPWESVAAPGPGETVLADEGLDPITAYDYRVRACNAGGCSDWSPEASATTHDLPPAAPTDPIATATSPTSVHLTWTDASDNEEGFEVERRLAPDAPWGVVASPGPGETALVDPVLEPATTYDYRVRACNGFGCSPWSNTASATTEAPGPNLSIAALTLTQRVQRLQGDVPLMADLPAHLRVYATASAPNGLQPEVEVELWIGGALAHTETLGAGGTGVPTGVQPSSLAATWNWTVPASLVQPGLAVLARVDPGNAVYEADETDNAFPAAGAPGAVEVWSAPRFDVTFVPVRQSVNGRLGDVDPGTTDAFMAETRRMFPIADDHVLVHEEYVTDAPALQSNDANGAWGTILGEIHALRVAEGSARHYYGVVDPDYGGGIAGIGYIGWPAALGWDRLPSGSGVAAHEWGHNMGRRHSPGCGAGNPDPSYPHAGGLIGAWGWDLGTATLRSPSAHYDLMTYCGPEWISDYVYERILQFRGGAPMLAASGRSMPPPAEGTPTPVPQAERRLESGLLLWGRVAAGEAVLEPVLPVEAPPHLAVEGDALRLEGRGPEGDVLFSFEFDPVPVADARDGEGHFAFVIPTSSLGGRPLARLELIGAEVRGARESSAAPGAAPGGPSARVTPAADGTVELTWDAALHPMVLVRDASTGQVLSFARGGSVRLRSPSDAVELTFSHGLGGPAPILRTVR